MLLCMHGPLRVRLVGLEYGKNREERRKGKKRNLAPVPSAALHCTALWQRGSVVRSDLEKALGPGGDLQEEGRSRDSR